MSDTIVLCGFMGCGKTTVGRLLAQRLNLCFIDMDEQIERESSLCVPQIFAQYGEGRFRVLEREMLKRLLTTGSAVIATGGGTVSDPLCHELLHGNGCPVVFLDTPFEVCYGRIKQSDRPLVLSNTREQLHELYQSRIAAYLASSNLHMHVDNLSDTIDAIEAALQPKT